MKLGHKVEGEAKSGLIPVMRWWQNNPEYLIVLLIVILYLLFMPIMQSDDSHHYKYNHYRIIFAKLLIIGNPFQDIFSRQLCLVDQRTCLVYPTN